MPGGHRYRFEIRGTDAARALGNLPSGRREKLEHGEAMTLMHEIDRLIAKIADVPRDCDYFLNTVEVLEVDGSMVVAEGQCSVVLGRGPR